MVDLVNSRRDGRFRRSGGQFNDPLSPTQRTQFIGRDVPHVMSGYQGLEGLNAAFSQFFGQAANALDGMARAEHALDKVRIEQENEVQATEGMRDAIVRSLSGEPFDPSAFAQADDMDYVTAYTRTYARQVGVDLATRFQEQLMQLPSDADVDAFTQEWITTELRNGERVGVGDPMFDGEVLGVFSKLTAEARGNHKVNAVKVKVLQGRQALAAELGGTLLHLEAGDMGDIYERALLLHPGEEHKAASFVMDSMLAAAGSVPERIRKVSSVLEESGFYDRFPDARVEIEHKLVTREQTAMTVESMQAYEDIGRRIMGLSGMSDPNQIREEATGIIADLVVTRDRYGKGGQFDAQWGAALKHMESAAQQIATFNAMNAMAAKALPLDQSLVRKNMKAYFKAAGVDPMEHPEAAAEIVTRMSYTIDQDTQAEMSAALDGESPERFAAAVRFYYSIEQNGGDAGLRDTISSSHRATYEYAKRQLFYARREPADVWKDIRGSRMDLSVVDKTSWKDIIPKASSVTDAELKAAEKLQDALEEHLPGLTGLPPTVKRDLLEEVKHHHLMRNKGQTSLDDTIKDVVKGVIPSLTLFPGPNGSTLVAPGAMPRVVAETDEMGLPLKDENGQVRTRPAVPFAREVVNPETGEKENTIQTFRRDMQSLTSALGGTVDGLTDKSGNRYSLDPYSFASSNGVYIVNSEHGTPVFFTPGTKLNIGGTEVTIPENFEEAEDFLLNFDWSGASQSVRLGDKPGSRPWHERTRLIPYAGLGFVLGYVPGFVGRLPTTEEKQKEWEAAPQRRTPSDQPTGFMPPEDRIRPGSIWDEMRKTQEITRDAMQQQNEE